ncbi:MAG: 50S ribosomal protein L24e [archaeon]|nr:50S ribosomal protein L24e [archaeon]
MKCTYCGKKIEEGTGKLVVQKDGKIYHYCSKKCEKNNKMRPARKVRWTETYRKQVKGK